MKIVHLTDIHANLDSLEKIQDIDQDGIIILSGDITHFGQKDDMTTIIHVLKKKFKQRILAVTGNCDYPNSIDALTKEHVSIENLIAQFDNFQVCGVGGSLPCPGKTPNEFKEEDYKEILFELGKRLEPNKPIVFVSHQPPYKTKNDKVLLGIHVGSKAIRGFIEENKPVVCLTGHIHEGKAIDFIGECAIINPGPFRNGHYAVIDHIGEPTQSIKVY